MFKKLWNRFLTRPAPIEPERELFKTIAYGFVFGLLAIPVVPLITTAPQTAHFMDFPLRVTAYAAFAGFYGIGISLLGQVGKKRAIIVTLVLLAVVSFAMYRLLNLMFHLSDFEGGIDDAEWVTKNAYFVTCGCLLVMLVTCGIGWVKWLRNKSGNADMQVR